MRSIDVFVPCYNYGRFLRKCVTSVLDQNDVDLRVLIIDDGSSDDSAQIAEQLRSTDNRVEFIRHQINMGHIRTYNEGIDWARADYMMLLSADDLLSTGALFRAVSAMESNHTVGFVYGRAIRFDGEPKDAVFGPHDVDQTSVVVPGIEFIRRLCVKPVNPVDTATVVVRTALQRRIGGYRPELPHSGDLEMWLRLAAKADVCELGTVQAYTRLHGHNMRNTYEQNMGLGDFQQKREAFRYFFRDTDHDTNMQVMNKIVRRALAEEAVWKAAIAFESDRADSIDALLCFAKEVDSQIVKTSVWWKLSIKRRVGARLWAAVAPSISRLRAMHRQVPVRSAQHSDGACGDGTWAGLGR